MPASENDRQRILGIVGIGLDGDDGHRRLTRTDAFTLMGGSAETHEQMQETAIRFEEGLEKRGKSLQEAEVQEIVDLLHEALESAS